jgi:hypothetical protein
MNSLKNSLHKIWRNARRGARISPSAGPRRKERVDRCPDKAEYARSPGNVLQIVQLLGGCNVEGIGLRVRMDEKAGHDLRLSPLIASVLQRQLLSQHNSPQDTTQVA